MHIKCYIADTLECAVLGLPSGTTFNIMDLNCSLSLSMVSTKDLCDPPAKPMTEHKSMGRDLNRIAIKPMQFNTTHLPPIYSSKVLCAQFQMGLEKLDASLEHITLYLEMFCSPLSMCHPSAQSQ